MLGSVRGGVGRSDAEVIAHILEVLGTEFRGIVGVDMLGFSEDAEDKKEFVEAGGSSADTSSDDEVSGSALYDDGVGVTSHRNIVSRWTKSV
ncbi:MAG: hypothetical protein AAFY15_12470, partial [Cyanobacteria bacterium J06648_11]